MSMTEEEAREKWCPFVRLVVGDVDKFTPSANRMATIDDPQTTRLPKASYCIASECMMWQEIGHKRDDEPRGYCGLIRS